MQHIKRLRRPTRGHEFFPFRGAVALHDARCHGAGPPGLFFLLCPNLLKPNNNSMGGEFPTRVVESPRFGVYLKLTAFFESKPSSAVVGQGNK